MYKIPDVEWAAIGPMIEEIKKLKKEKNVLIMAHNYMTPDIYHGVADLVGDSLYLAERATRVKEDNILMCGVHFMAETVKLLNPDKTVLIPDMSAGCSLAESITPEDVLELKRKHPGVPVVVYVNTSAAVKAVSDITCTSGNAVDIVNGLDSNEVIFIPDRYLGANVQKQTDKKLIFWGGSCEVHEKFTVAQVEELRRENPGIVIMAHPECPREVIEACDFSGSTAKMVQFVETRRHKKVALITECNMATNVSENFPEIEFIRPCNLCPHMRKITVPKILECLQNWTGIVEVEEQYREGGRAAIEKMLVKRSKGC